MALLRAMDSFTPGDHVCLVHDDPARRHAAVFGFLRSGIVRGERVLYLSPDPDSDDIAAQLLALGAPGQVEVFPADGAYGDAFDPERFLAGFRGATERALDDGYPALRAAGGFPRHLADAASPHEFAAYERQCNELFRDGRLVSMCEYDRRWFSPATVHGVLEAHPHAAFAVAGDGRLRVEVVEPAHLRASGWIDLASLGVLGDALAAAVQVGEDVRLDMGGVGFADVAGLRLLAEAARELHRSDRRLTLVAVPPTVHTVLSILGWHELDGLELAIAPA